MHVEHKLEELGIELPAPLKPPGNFELVTVHDGLAYIAGHGPFDGSTLLMAGLVGADLTVEEGYEAARLTALSMLASLKHALGDLDRVTRWLRAVGYGMTVTTEPALDADGRPSRDWVVAQVDAAVRHGAHGVAVLGIATETNKLDAGERRTVMEWTAEALRKRMPLAVTIAEPSVHGQVAFARAARDAGADYVVVGTQVERDGARAVRDLALAARA